MAVDWVKARAGATAVGVLNRLAEVVKRDLASADMIKIGAEFDRKDRDRIVVVNEYDQGVAFRAHEGKIEIHTKYPYEKARHVFTPVLTDKGKVRLRDNATGDDLKLWQVSRCGLEDLLFVGQRWR